MRICCISDTHGKHRELSIPQDIDLLLHAGDMTMSGRPREIIDFDNWLGSLDWIKYKVIIAGNHDWLFQNDPGFARSLITNAIYLQDNEIIINNVSIYGSPWTPMFCNWAFMDENMASRWKVLHEGYKPDILLTHGPAYGILDRTDRGVMAGCDELLKAIDICQPKLHVFGHIHEGYGSVLRSTWPHTVGNATQHINAANADIQYRMSNAPIIYELA